MFSRGSLVSVYLSHSSFASKKRNFNSNERIRMKATIQGLSTFPKLAQVSGVSTDMEESEAGT